MDPQGGEVLLDGVLRLPSGHGPHPAFARGTARSESISAASFSRARCRRARSVTAGRPQTPAASDGVSPSTPTSSSSSRSRRGRRARAASTLRSSSARAAASNGESPRSGAGQAGSSSLVRDTSTARERRQLR